MGAPAYCLRNGARGWRRRRRSRAYRRSIIARPGQAPEVAERNRQHASSTAKADFAQARVALGAHTTALSRASRPIPDCPFCILHFDFTTAAPFEMPSIRSIAGNHWPKGQFRPRGKCKTQNAKRRHEALTKRAIVAVEFRGCVLSRSERRLFYFRVFPLAFAVAGADDSLSHRNTKLA
jgi:hypothetical protein